MTSLRQRMIEDMQIRVSIVCTPFQPVTGSAGTGGDSHLSDLFDERKAAGDQFDSHRYFCASLPLQSHSQEELDY